jgi:hypothetical protein
MTETNRTAASNESFFIGSLLLRSYRCKKTSEVRNCTTEEKKKG